MYPAGNDARDGGLSFYGIIFLSLLAHFLILSFLAFTPSLLPSHPLTFGPAYSVQLVSMPTASPDNRITEAAMKEILAGLPAQPPILNKATLDNKVILNHFSAASLASRQTGKKTDESIEKTLEAMRKNLTSAAKPHLPSPVPAAALKNKTEQTTFPLSLSDAPSNEGDSHAGTRIYYALIWSRIKGLWTIPRGLLPQENIESLVNIQILRDGTIAHAALEKSSGNRYFDDSALRTVKKANPLPPLPEAFREGAVEVGIRFRSAEFR